MRQRSKSNENKHLPKKKDVMLDEMEKKLNFKLKEFE